MADFPSVPDNPYQYENTFDYSVWTPNTEIQCCNVKWDASYRDVVWFDSIQDRDSYFESLSGYSFIINNMIYLRYGEPVRVNAPFSVVNKFNYLVVRNKIQPVPSPIDIRTPDTFFYFITDVQYIAPNTTQMNLQLDVWTTYHNNVDFGLCYINRGHIGIANENSTEQNLIDYLTDLEGLECGNEYEVIHQEVYNFQDEAPWIMIVSSADLSQNPGTISSPSLTTATGSSCYGLPQGCSVYVCEITEFLHYMASMKSYPWVTQCILQISIIPKNVIESSQLVSIETSTGDTLYSLTHVLPKDNSVVLSNFYKNFIDNLPSKYRHLIKFITSPYCYLEVTTLTGGEMYCKPESFNKAGINTNNVTFNIQSVITPGDARIVIYPKSYNSTVKGDISYDSTSVISASQHNIHNQANGEYLDMNVIVDNFPQLSLVNNMYQYYLAASTNTRKYLYGQADWSYNKAIAGAEAARNNDIAGIIATTKYANIEQEAIARKRDIEMMQTIGNAASDAAAKGAIALESAPGTNTRTAGMINAANSAVHGAINAAAAYKMAEVESNRVANTATASKEQQRSVMNNNFDYQLYAAQGDYETTIQGIQAKYQDLQLSQPSTSGLNGGNCFNFANGSMIILFKWKMIKRNFIEQIGSFWLRYGYYVNRWMVPPKTLKCMDKFTYWKMAFCAIESSDIPESFKETIRGILESGVTVWSNADDINITMLDDNRIIPGIRY